jgi:phenylalanyl-tRNA synthetase beta chain
MPPIINGDHSKISLDTKNIFIEATATDLTKAKIVLDTIICLFSTHCKIPFVAEFVEVVNPDGSVIKYPELPYRTESISVEKANQLIGIK